jgi:hypothetical protein
MSPTATKIAATETKVAGSSGTGCEQQSREHAGQQKGAGTADGPSLEGKYSAVAYDLPDHARSLCSERHPDADLMGFVAPPSRP